MDDEKKPKFGVNSAPDEPKQQPAETQTQASEAPKFGTQAAAPEEQPKAKTAPKFGTQATEATTEQESNFFQRIYALQPTNFWVKQYIFSIIACVLVWDSKISVPLEPLWLLLNLVLYPVATTIMLEADNAIENFPSSLRNVAFFLLGDFKRLGWGGIMAPVVWLSQVVLFFVRWGLGFILGTIGLIYMNSQAKKMHI